MEKKGGFCTVLGSDDGDWTGRGGERIHWCAETGTLTLDEFGHVPDIVGEQRAAAAMRGSVEALREVWQQHRRWVAGVLLAHKPRDVDLEDLLQDVALSMVKRIGDLRDPAAVRSWLRQIALNAARASGRRQRVREPERRALRLAGSEGADVPVVGGGGDVGVESEGRDEGVRLLDVARRLPEGYAEPLILRAVRGMSYREIGRVMELPETTVETRIARARRMVRELMAEKMRESDGGVGRAVGGPERIAGAKGEVDR